MLSKVESCHLAHLGLSSFDPCPIVTGWVACPGIGGGAPGRTKERVKSHFRNLKVAIKLCRMIAKRNKEVIPDASLSQHLCSRNEYRRTCLHGSHLTLLPVDAASGYPTTEVPSRFLAMS
jgi:hypothetical protein